MKIDMTIERLATIITMAIVAEGLKETDKEDSDRYMRRFKIELMGAGIDPNDMADAMGRVRL